MLTIEDQICEVCGTVVRRGITNESETFCVHRNCLETYMNNEYGKNNWILEDDGAADYERYYVLHYFLERGGMCYENLVCKDFE